MIACLAGEIGRGKSHIANLLIKNYGFKKLSFADKMKKDLSKYYNIPFENFSKIEEKQRKQKYVITQQLLCNLSNSFNVPYMQLRKDKTEVNSLRELLQVIGTDYIRATDEYAHIMGTINELNDDINYVIDDCRFANEAYISDICFYLERDTVKYEENKHISENFNKSLADVIIDNNGKDVDTCKKIIDVVKDFKKLDKLGI